MNILPYLRLMRPQQWVKNGFVAAPLFLTPKIWAWEHVLHVLIGIVAFCFVSSATYVLNDLVDRHADLMHEKKRHRPLPSGQVSPFVAKLMVLGCLAIGVSMAATLSTTFVSVVLYYVVLQILYCLYLKNHAIIDVLSISLGFIFRVEGGASLVTVPVTSWIIIATGLLALFQALAKRRDDLCLNLTNQHRKSLDGYNKPFLDVAIGIVLSALVVVYLIYTTDQTVMERLGTHDLYYTAPFVVAGVLRYLQITYVFERSGSPTEILLKDPFVLCSVLGWMATFVLLTFNFS